MLKRTDKDIECESRAIEINKKFCDLRIPMKVIATNKYGPYILQIECLNERQLREMIKDITGEYIL